ncbi:hypothetical protein UMZ34_24245 [Halopseudomonas pachastrellae]|nr:hypothetical protein UMZ34_24245 [Halopseudomonas pachastrellae]
MTGPAIRTRNELIAAHAAHAANIALLQRTPPGATPPANAASAPSTTCATRCWPSTPS